MGADFAGADQMLRPGIALRAMFVRREGLRSRCVVVFVPLEATRTPRTLPSGVGYTLDKVSMPAALPVSNARVQRN